MPKAKNQSYNVFILLPGLLAATLLLKIQHEVWGTSCYCPAPRTPRKQINSMTAARVLLARVTYRPGGERGERCGRHQRSRPLRDDSEG
eukprot:scaffold382_cov380-Prasinococcus_capsulatus_cf.AAC.35